MGFGPGEPRGVTSPWGYSSLVVIPHVTPRAPPKTPPKACEKLGTKAWIRGGLDRLGRGYLAVGPGSPPTSFVDRPVLWRMFPSSR